MTNFSEITMPLIFIALIIIFMALIKLFNILGEKFVKWDSQRIARRYEKENGDRKSSNNGNVA